ncbi:TonB-dependent siderophore receptor [Mangrovicoccus algicola]|uniref:TonB-dependent siderophore receptor n=1 Tax=Mangrovicoccus algicola TaxID=2771008 RepID=A0A8J6YZY4_9RHOB|nr:TonB-dependent siderophore receptor [Mangrovicoccus algicola]MBE3639874.1 TonB-dependent siderophore receptor [Mangrovicoccus algicola]
MTTPRTRALLAGASLVCLAAAAQAQSTADLIVLDNIVLTGRGDPLDPVDGYVAPSSQTATKSGTPLLQTPASISVLTGEQIEDQGGTNLGDVLGYTSGVTAQPFGTDPRFDAPSIRGFGGENAQYLNGLRLLRELGSPSFEIYSLERIEILKGPSSVLYGSGTPGGIINQVQKRAQGVDFGEVGIGFGDPKATEGFIDVNRTLGDNHAVRVTGVVRETEEDVEDLTNERGYVGLATRSDLGEGVTLQFLGSYQQDNPITPAGVPYDLVGKADDEDLREFYAGDPDDDESDREVLNLGFELEQDFGNGWALNSGFRYQKFDWDYTGFYVNNTVADGDTITRGGNHTVEDSETLNIDTRLTGEVSTGAALHRLLFGLDVRQYDIEESTDFLTADSISFSDPSYGGANLSAPWFSSTDDLTQRQIGAYVQDEIEIGALSISAALRHDWVEIEGESWTNFAGTTYIDQSSESTTGRLGVSYLFATGIAPYLSYSTSFDPVVGTDIDGRALDPTEAEQWEAGVKYQPAGYDALFTAAVFRIDQSNVSTSVTENGITGTRQLGKVRSEGVELEAVASLAEGWNLRGAYTWLDTDIREGDNEGHDLRNAPVHNASLWLNREFTGGAVDGLTLGGGVRYIGERYGDDANLYALEDVTVFDLQAAYELTENAHLSVNVTNLTDEAYVANCGSFGCYYGDGRTLQAKLTYKW